jgi:phosphosulfolactate phosphohydrolase-like enzyme
VRRRPADLSSLRAGTVVVMDVLRMTTTAAVLLSRPSCDRVAVAATLEALQFLKRPTSELVIVSELAAASRWAQRVDNSPAQVSSMAFGDRIPVLVTTNGTQALLAAAACAERVLVASFRDLHAVARHLSFSESVVLVPAGDLASGEGRIEDDLCAEALESLLAGREPDLSAAAAAIRADPRTRRRAERERGFLADLDLALQTDPRAAVLELQPGGRGTGNIVRAGDVRSARRN